MRPGLSTRATLAAALDRVDPFGQALDLGGDLRDVAGDRIQPAAGQLGHLVPPPLEHNQPARRCLRPPGRGGRPVRRDLRFSWRRPRRPGQARLAGREDRGRERSCIRSGAEGSRVSQWEIVRKSGAPSSCPAAVCERPLTVRSRRSASAIAGGPDLRITPPHERGQVDRLGRLFHERVELPALALDLGSPVDLAEDNA